ncbi:MAG: hypothetical protein IPJ65_26510 [Archangiaceae bacterium]|nr:hypothetical protein [Archangiaceae bacterium]
MMLAPLIAMALAASGPKSEADSAYEQTLIDWGLQLHGVELEPDPEGKRIDGVLTAREDVFAQSDPVPTWLNVFHGRTREHVVLREVLLEKGAVWSQKLADETERNLRSLVIIAVAKVVAVKSPEGGVTVLVITKDRWSFRANWDYLVVGSVLERLHVPITEVNLLGQGIEVTLDPYLRRDTFQLGEEVIWRRFLDTKLRLREDLGLVINRVNSRLEGSFGVVQVGQPLLSLQQKWGFNVFAVWDVRRVRIFRGRTVWSLGYPDDAHPTTQVPYIYDQRQVDVAALGTRQFGSEYISRVSAGIGGYAHLYQPPAETPLSPDVSAWFISTRLPRSEDAAYLYGEWSFFRARYVQKHDLETFGLTEDLQLGPRLLVAARWAVPVIAKSSFVELGATVRWTFLLGDDVLALSGAATSRFQIGGPIVNERYTAEVTNWSPPFEGGRFVTRVLGDFRARDLDNGVFVLGAGGGLRGTPSGALVGRNMVLGNFEYRTRPFNITTLLAGLVLFYDVGTAFDVKPAFTHTVGAGLRILIPQLNTQVIRLDLGFVLADPDSTLSVDRLSSTFGQVTQIRPDFLDDPI